MISQPLPCGKMFNKNWSTILNIHILVLAIHLLLVMQNPYLHENCFMSFLDATTMLECVTQSQVQKTSHAAGHYHQVACHKPFLSHQVVTKRLQWEGENDGRDWNCGVCWTDETSIKWGECPSHAKVTRLPGEEYLFKTIVPTFKSGCKSLIAWAYVTYNWKGP